MSGQRPTSTVEPSHRSIHPNIPGIPWYAALLLAVTATAIGYGIDSGHKELTHVFAGFYIAGCVAAVLAVRQDGLFTAIIQPPLILFCAVPGAYWLFHDAKIGHLKDLLINCGYPLIERFPLMLGTAGIVLLIGLVRWYFGQSQRATSAANASDDGESADIGSVVGGFVAKAVAKLQAIVRPESGDDDADEAAPARARRDRGTGSASRARRTARSDRSAARSARARSRHTREPLDAAAEPGERRSSRRGSATARDYDAAERRSRRRPRPDADADPRGQSARDGRREPRTRRNPYERPYDEPYERPAPRSSRFDGYDRYDPPGAPEHFGRYDSYEPTYEPRRRRPATNGNNGTHHPISQVRYRGADEPAEPRPERRNRSRTYGRPQRPPTESWEYDA
ncbi:DUF6542 domain-containing protein [Mycobacterium europaeum]|uniref:DUF6542 domain-containing protein n=1 Tax=Mycobacterium europaeum TaxID=761804 RepID=UPI002AE058C9|nr:DUF6542 domain-containing protein [Mycobacterium europaeum]MEA1159493.1 DUF6542 domain-containing protein [Mycobacterium europaeum]